MKTLVSFNCDPITHEGEEHSHIVTGRNSERDLKPFDRFDEAREDLNNGVLAFDRLSVDRSKKDDVIRKMGGNSALVPVAKSLEVAADMSGVHRNLFPKEALNLDRLGPNY
jgi:hypothetical protein